jgi:acetyl esterase/lipase
MPAGNVRRAPRNPALARVAEFLEWGADRLGFLAANAPALLGAYKRHANIAYGTDPQQRLDVYVPSTGRAPRAVIVFWHGGRWTFGDKNDYRFVGAALAGAGYVTVVANYRHYPQVKMPGFLADAARAALWSLEHAAQFGADDQRIFLMGHSAGAHLAAMLALDPRHFLACGKPAPHIAGVIGLSGPYDFLPLLEADVQDMFGPPQNYADSQPINFVTPEAAPMLLIHGLQDLKVWPKNSQNLAAALTKSGVPVTLRLYPAAAHAMTLAALIPWARTRAPTLSDITAFIDGAAIS